MFTEVSILVGNKNCFYAERRFKLFGHSIFKSQIYYYKVTAKNLLGESFKSSEVNAALQNGTVVFSGFVVQNGGSGYKLLLLSLLEGRFWCNCYGASFKWSYSRCSADKFWFRLYVGTERRFQGRAQGLRRSCNFAGYFAIVFCYSISKIFFCFSHKFGNCFHILK